MGQQHRNMSSAPRARGVLIRICATGAMVALSVIFCRFLGFPQSGNWRIEVGFLPIAFVAFLWGPLWAGAGYGASDLIGAAIFTGVNPFITLEKVFTGVIMGVFFHGGRRGRGRIGVWRNFAAFAIIAVAGDFAIMTLIFVFAFGQPWTVALPIRALNALVNFIGRTLIMELCDIRLTKRLEIMGEKHGF